VSVSPPRKKTAAIVLSPGDVDYPPSQTPRVPKSRDVRDVDEPTAVVPNDVHQITTYFAARESKRGNCYRQSLPSDSEVVSSAS